MKKLLRLIVMCCIKHEDVYYKTGIESLGLDYKKFTQNEIAAWKAVVKGNEADFLISFAFDKDAKLSKDSIKKVNDELFEKINNSINKS